MGYKYISNPNLVSTQRNLCIEIGKSYPILLELLEFPKVS